MAKNISRFLDTNGNGTGTKNANGNYSGAAEIFYIQPPAGSRYQINRLIVEVEDAAGMIATEYGSSPLEQPALQTRTRRSRSPRAASAFHRGKIRLAITSK